MRCPGARSRHPTTRSRSTRACPVAALRRESEGEVALPSRRALLSVAAAAVVAAPPNPAPAVAVVVAPPLPPLAPLPLPLCPAPAAEAAGRAAWSLGLATPAPVRAASRLTGLLPSRVTNLETEVARAAAATEAAVAARDAAHAPGSDAGAAERAATNVAAYTALSTARAGLGDAAFFGLLRADPARYLPCVYTPAVGDAILAWGRLPSRPPGLYLSAADAGAMAAAVANWPLPDPTSVRLAVITDGARILGLGDQGAGGMGIPVGKCLLHAAGGGLGPGETIPVMLDVGCDSAAVRGDPLYVGLPQGRAKGAAYDALIDEALSALVTRFGPGLIIHFEDFAAGTADALLRRAVACRVGGGGGADGTPLSICPPSFSDDIQATGAAALAALLGAAALPGVPALTEGRFLFFGAGQAAVGTARAVVAALVESGLTPSAAKARIFLLDSRGLVSEGRAGASNSALKAEFARPVGEAQALGLSGTDLAAAVDAIRPTVLVGAAAVGGAFTDPVLRAMGAVCARPVILALSNPDTAAECSAVAVDAATGGRGIFAAGTAQPDHASSRTGRPVSPAFANNALVFPGVGLGAAVSGATVLGPGVWLAAARAVAACVRPEDAAVERALPAVGRLVEVTAAVGAAVAATAVASGAVDAGRCDGRLLAAARRGEAALQAAAEAAVKEAQYRPGK